MTRRHAAARPLLGRTAALALAVLFALALLAGGASWYFGQPRVSDVDLKSSVERTIADLRAKWDPRLFVLEATADVQKGVVTLTGTVDGAKRAELVGAVKALEGVRRVEDKLTGLPDPALGPRTAGLVAVAVANLGDAPGRDEGEHIVTQARLADPVDVLREEQGWYLVRMRDDGYLGWIRGENVIRTEPAAVAAYGEGEQAVVMAKFADILASVPAGGSGATGGSDGSGTPAPLVRAVMGTVLQVAPGATAGPDPAYVTVTLPSGETGFVRRSEVRLLPSAVAVWAERHPAEDIIALAEQFLGLPYLWGGTTSYGFDCSGFVQFVFGMNGYRLPRDADMQYAVGTPVGSRADLRPGDLVFFSTYKEGPSHIGIYIGGSRYIHSGSSGVAVNSFDPKAPDYSERLDERYLGARRVLGQGQ